MNLPIEYINEMKVLLGEEQYNLYAKSLNEERKVGIRINTNKISVEDFISISPFKIERIPYVDNGFWVEESDNVSKHPYYYAGLYYIQEPSAMIPASCLSIKKDDFVLDLCAAPGGKATEILSKSPAFLLANDISYSRTIPLTKNLEMFGGTNYVVSAETPQKLANFFPDFFTKIVVDAPCSGEGMFRKDPSLINSWINKGPAEYSEEQYEILSTALKMLKPGGLLIYSTCTFSICEDEDIIGRILSEHTDLELVKLPKYNGFSDGFKSINYPDYDYKNCIRIFPHLLNGEGHFVAGLYKKIDDKNNNIINFSSRSKLKLISENKLPAKCKEFIDHISSDLKNKNFFINNGFLYMIDNYAFDFIINSIHYTRTGCLIGQIKDNGSFSVNSGFALSLNYNQFDNVLNMNESDERIIKYLKGETILAKDNDKATKGYVLICVNTFPLGFAKFDGNKYKNLYTPGWRYNGN